MDLIKEAIQNNELGLFFMGIGKYNVFGWSDLDHPTDYKKLWSQEIIPYLNSIKDKKKTLSLHKIFNGLINYSEDRNLGLYSIILHLNYFYFYKSQQLISQALYDDNFAGNLKLELIRNKHELCKDTRWAGASWNSPMGMWAPLLDVARVIKDEYNGIDFVPEGE